jgi:hypothetical protein
MYWVDVHGIIFQKTTHGLTKDKQKHQKQAKVLKNGQFFPKIAENIYITMDKK